ncbi:MAG: asparagine synthase (glutamine-hydrolyzing) [Lachnospiraceae bacterium]|nr:asparagine synthase (glutamine-hydrolyzing) [Lachnospiraceae bacterium]
MCGILGGNNEIWDYNAGISCMRYRGPDGIKVVKKRKFTLAFARLAIMDLSNQGMQPMFSEDENVGIVYNGEIYGYQELREELVAMGYHFRSFSDTEVILNAYLAWGNDFINKIDGMYGMAIYDERDKTIRLYRDRAGIKPLYYYCDGDNFGFASELKGILQMCTNIKFHVDNTAIYDYLNYAYIPDPKTMYRNICKLEPGYHLVYHMCDRKIVTKASYWKLRLNSSCGKQRKQKTLLDELRYLIRKSVGQQMVADVPVGAFLSGGIDSSVVAYESSRQNPRIETFSIGFADRRYDELGYAQKLIDKYELHSNQRIFNRKDMERLYHMLYDWYTEPFADTSAFPAYLLCSLAREKVVVALTGDGGDELFGGYPRYTLLLKRKERSVDNMLVSAVFQQVNKYCKLGKWKNILLDDLNCLQNTYLPSLSLDDAVLRKRLGIPVDYDKFWYMRKYYVKDLPPITRGQYLDFKTYLPGSVLTKVDRVSMAVSLETRVPLLSREIIEFAFGLSQEDRCPNGVLKGLLKTAYEKELGRALVQRKKQGFSMPTEYISVNETAREKVLGTIWRIR